MRKEGHAGTCFLRLRDGKADYAYEILEERTAPCYILQEGEFVCTANYHEGTVMVYSVKDKKPDIVARIENGEEAGCHQILIHGQDMMVPCLEQDKIRMFDMDNGFALSGEIMFPEGSGPRHGVFNREHTKLFVVSERSRFFRYIWTEAKQLPRRPYVSPVMRGSCIYLYGGRIS